MGSILFAIAISARSDIQWVKRQNEHMSNAPMRGSRTFCQGWGVVVGWGWGRVSRPDYQKTALATLLLDQLILQFKSGLATVYFKETINFQGLREGPTFFRGWWSSQFQGVQLFPEG